MAREDPEVRLRLATALKDRIAEAAKANNRSMNSEVVARLEGSFSTEAQVTIVPGNHDVSIHAVAAHVVDEVFAKLAELEPLAQLHVLKHYKRKAKPVPRSE